MFEILSFVGGKNIGGIAFSFQGHRPSIPRYKHFKSK